MSARRGPPRVARWIIEHVLPSDVREDVSGDLIEVFHRDSAHTGSARARARYWRKAASMSILFGAERCRDLLGGGLMPNGVSWLEVKLALRMLVRYPGLSFAGAMGMAVVMACGVAVGIFNAVVHGSLPFDDGERIVAIENWDTSANVPHNRAVHDFIAWREQLTSVEEIGAYRLVRRLLQAPGRGADPVRVAEISASVFDIAGVPPIIGRPLTREDEAAAATPVIVIGESEWRERFGADPRVLGTPVQLGNVAHLVVGVMPRAFRFPVNETFWAPLRVNPSEYQRGQGPKLYVFGRLADGATLESAQAELTTLGQRAAADFQDTHARLRPRVLPYTDWFFAEMQNGESFLFGGAVLMLLGIICANVAVLVYARTAARGSEIAVRTALGANRSRIVSQMFVEGLALAAVAAGAGLGIAVAMRSQMSALVEQAPFWVNANVTSGNVVAHVLLLTLLGGGIIGAVPALQATRRRHHSGLHSAATLSGWRVGRTYMVLTVVQVALAVAILPAAVSTTWTAVRLAGSDPGFAAEEYLLAQVFTEEDFGARVESRLDDLETRLESAPGVAGATFMTAIPGSEHERARIEVGPGQSHPVAIGQVRVDYFGTFEVPLLAGRDFVPQDVTSVARPIIVNQTFAEKILGGNVVGRQVRQLPGGDRRTEATMEIIGVVPDFPAQMIELTMADATIYEPLGRGSADETPATAQARQRADEVLVAVRVRGAEAASFARPLREITMSVGGGLQIGETRTMDAFLREEQNEYRIAAIATTVITSSVLLLSATGLYALIAFTVTQRRREIGIRVAVGARHWQILFSLLSRTFWQLAAGVTIGVALAALWDSDSRGELTGGIGLPLVFAVGAFVMLVGLTAAVVPARRGLRIQPTDALRDE